MSDSIFNIEGKLASELASHIHDRLSTHGTLMVKCGKGDYHLVSFEFGRSTWGKEIDGKLSTLVIKPVIQRRTNERSNH